MLSQTATTAKPEMADSATNTVSGAITLVNRASTPPSMLNVNAFIGIPRAFTREK
ncbi:hypothetical protein D3C76_1557220 [compost metagenome]